MRSCRKSDTVRLRSSSVHESGSGSSSRALFFMAPTPAPDQAPASVRFYKLIFAIVLVCLKLNGKWNVWSRLHKNKRKHQTFL